jgi:hypothetical protein
VKGTISFGWPQAAPSNGMTWIDAESTPGDGKNGTCLAFAYTMLAPSADQSGMVPLLTIGSAITFPFVASTQLIFAPFEVSSCVPEGLNEKKFDTPFGG